MSSKISEARKLSFGHKKLTEMALFDILSLSTYRDEALKNQYISTMENNKSIVGKREPWIKRGFGAISVMTGRAIYAIMRSLNPELVVETGVAMGVSTTYVLAGLHVNRHGELVSIDVESRCGEIIPEELKNRWVFHVGKSVDILPKLDHEKIDIFIHDSLHSYKNMTFEFEWVYPKIPPKGVLIVHDIKFNNAIFDFAKKHDEDVLFIQSSKSKFTMGAIVKGFSYGAYKEQVMFK